MLTKNIGYFTSTSVPSIMVGRGQYTGTAQGGLFLTYSTGTINGPWTTITIDGRGNYYERAIAFTAPGQAYPGLIASKGGTTVYYQNPLNSGRGVTTQWPAVLIANRPCHDIHLADIDGDGKLDVVCSSTVLENDHGGYIAYQNSRANWTVASDSTPKVGDGIGITNINGIWDIVSAFNGVTYLYWNPLNRGSHPRTAAWTAYNIGIGDEGTAVEAGRISNAPVVYECANEAEDPWWGKKPWNLGCVMFQPNGTSYTRAWNRTNLDPSWSAVHEINAAIYPQGLGTYGRNGKPVLPTYINGLSSVSRNRPAAPATVNGTISMVATVAG